ncbi:MAG: fumarylacetoacetate hydrolase family protein [Deltaproteobacteria bacterium]|nr:fumarylacetoacetate hydrolase family protein [Deltaproteobacteria bacterium]
MRIVRYLDATGTHHGCEHPDGSITRLSGDITSFTDTGEPVTPTKILAPIEPRAIIGIGLNYRGHAKETGLDLPESPIVFMKNPAAVQNPGDPIVIPTSCTREPEVDYECELAVIIGTPARNVSPEDALSHVLGYTAANDVSARRWQKRGGAGQWIRGKSFDTFCPLGPAIVTTDEIPDPQTLHISTTLNGKRLQDSHTSDMIFPVSRLISELSCDMTLLPGTVILTGTPEGVGFVREPPIFLKAGDTVTVELERVGTLTNPVTGA